MSNPDVIAAFIATLPRSERIYAAAFAHWLTNGDAVEQAESRRLPITKRRAAAIRRAIVAAMDRGDRALESQATRLAFGGGSATSLVVGAPVHRVPTAKPFTLTPDMLGVRVQQDGQVITVSTHVVGVEVDRTELMGYSVGNLALARRLAHAIKAGKVFGPASIATDIAGRTYVRTDACVIGRRMNADLRRLGF